MRTLRAWLIRLGGLLRPHARDREFAEELAAHIRLHEQDNLRSGMSAAESRRNAQMRLGGATQVQEMLRERRSLPMIETLLQDLRFGLRTLRKNTGFAAIAISIMALGIGANTAMFSVVNTVLLKPLAYPEPQRIVTLASFWRAHAAKGQVSAPDYHDWHDQSTAFENMAYYEDDDTSVTAGPVGEYTHAALVTPEFFRVFRIEPIAGREFSADENKPGSSGAVIVSAAFAAAHFGGGAGALEHTLRIAGKTLNIVGVMPVGFGFPDNTAIWLPGNTIFPETESRSAHNYRVVGRLKKDVSLAQAQAQMTLIGTRLEEKFPESNKDKGVAVTELRDALVGDFRRTLYLMLGAVGLVLLIACANLANMLLARAVARSREMTIRLAVGAGRWRIVRQLLTESVTMAAFAGIAGVALAYWGARTLVALAPAEVPRLAEAGVDGRVLLFAVCISLVSSVLFGLAPALQILRVDLNKSLKQGSSKAVGGSSADRTRATLVVAEIALSVTLLVTAGLLTKSFVALHNVALGFHPEHVLIMQASVPASDLESARNASRFYKQLLSRVAVIPGVQSVGATAGVPGHPRSNGSYFLDHLPKEMDISAPNAIFSVFAPGTLETLGIPLKSGRDFQASDTYDAPFVAIVNEAFVRQSLPGKDPIGHMVYCGLDSMTPMRIVGVVGDVRQNGPADAPAPELMMAYEQHPEPSADLSVLARTSLEPRALTETMRGLAQSLNADVPVKFTTMEASLSEGVATPRFRTLLLGIFAGIAVLLAMAGVYGVMAYIVGQRANEIGLRMALGATPRDVLRMVLGRAVVLAGTGIALGLICAAGATQFLRTFLFGVTASDWPTYIAVAFALGIVALLASYIPARRAMRVDPMIALRYE